jgi:electron transfer flavoprotein alpha subunit
MANILAFAETRNGELRKIALEAMTAARAVADATGGKVDAFVAGAPGIADCSPQLAKFGADTVVVVEHAAFE